MSFKKLEQRFTETSGEIYTKFGNTGAVTPILPDSAQSRSSIKNDDRAIPTISLVRDTAFVSAILKSDKGKLFLAKQLLLQTGNTFVDTRLYNPTSFNLNLPPHIHLVRHVSRPIYNLLTPNREFRGAIQKETIKSFEQSNGLLNRIGSALSNLAVSPVAGLLYQPERTKYFSKDGKDPKEFYKRPEDVFFKIKDVSWFTPFLANTQELTQRGNKKTITFKTSVTGAKTDTQGTTKVNNGILVGLDAGYYGDARVNTKWYINSMVPEGNSPLLLRLMPASETETAARKPNTINPEGLYFIRSGGPKAATDPKVSVFYLSTTATGKNIFLNANALSVRDWNNKDDRNATVAYPLSKQIYSFINTATKIKEPTDEQKEKENTFRKLESKGTTNGYFQGKHYKLAGDTDGEETIEKSQILFTDSLSTSSSIKDPYNLKDITTPHEPKTDIISFVFSTVSPIDKTQEYVHFRAFINSFKQNVKTEFSEQRYLGRTERFVSYGGAKRTATLSFNIVAFSADEIETMWSRVNYLTGLAFPLGVSNGFMVPPLFRLTVGGIYVDQPVYIDTLEHEFISEEFTPFDIDAGVSQCVTVNMGITLLEKKSRFYNSPFYAIAG